VHESAVFRESAYKIYLAVFELRPGVDPAGRHDERGRSGSPQSRGTTVGLEALFHLRWTRRTASFCRVVDGWLAVPEILRIVPVREFEALHSFNRLPDSKVIDFPLHAIAMEETATGGREETERGYDGGRSSASRPAGLAWLHHGIVQQDESPGARSPMGMEPP